MEDKGFGSDNFAGVSPEIMKALQKVSENHQISYGGDIYTQRAVEDFEEIFGPDIKVYFVYSGTAANILGLSVFARSYNSVICAETAHINVDECGATEKQIGCKLITLPTPDGKLNVPLIKRHIHGFGVQHHSQPKIISISQCTELGTVYTPEEIRKITEFAHERGMYVHMDGARFANAVAYLDCDPKELTVEAGIDVMSFGGTKNGMMFGEAVILFNKEFYKEVKFIRKQQMQLHSKMRFIGAQFSALLKNDLWLKNAEHANRMARKLAQELTEFPDITITQAVEANSVFAKIPMENIEILQSKCFFYVWDENEDLVRWMCAFDTEEDDIDDFIDILRKYAV